MNTSEELARFKEEVRQRTRLVLEKVTSDQLDWMPEPQALTIRLMVRHMRLSLGRLSWQRLRGPIRIGLPGSMPCRPTRSPRSW